MPKAPPQSESPVAPGPAVLLTRPRAQSDRFARQLAVRLPGARVVISPLLEIVGRKLDVDAARYRGLIFTSENAVAAFAAQAPVRDVPVWCVGPRTERAARAAGFLQTAAAAGGDAAALVERIQADAPAGPLLHLRGVHVAADVAAQLRTAGIACDAAVVYDQPASALNDPAQALLGGDRTVLVPLFSPRTARLFVKAAAPLATAPLQAVAISPAAAAVWDAAGLPPAAVAARPDAGAMADALVRVAEGCAA